MEGINIFLAIRGRIMYNSLVTHSVALWRPLLLPGGPSPDKKAVLANMTFRGGQFCPGADISSSYYWEIP